MRRNRAGNRTSETKLQTEQKFFERHLGDNINVIFAAAAMNFK